MLFLKIMAVVLLLLASGLFATSRYQARLVEQEFPADGQFAEIDGVRMHYYEIAAGPDTDLPDMVFIHGASGNARDLMSAFAAPLQGRARMLFMDRPGAGYSQRGGAGMEAPDAQARLIAGLMEELGFGKAVIAGHSWGGSVAAAMGLNHGEQVAGLVFLAPATHPWPGGEVTWYYGASTAPLGGRLFTELLAVPFGNLQYPKSVRAVFKPDAMPPSYPESSATRLVLRPANFRYNAKDVSALHGHVSRLAPRYREIDAPSLVITGDSDDVVLANIHSSGLARDIKGAKLVWLENGGHMPGHARTDEVIAEIEALALRIEGRED